MGSALDRFYEGMGNNVVLRDSNGKPSIFVRHPKQYSDEFDSTYLPHTIHPAFMCGEGVVDDAVLWAKYLPSQLTSDGPYYSLPNAVPVWNETFPARLGHANGFSDDVTYMTIADYGLLVLMHHAKGMQLSATGNNAHGANRSDGTQYAISQSVSVGDMRTFDGYLWKCIKAHTTSTALLPTNAPGYWEKIKKVGGTLPAEDISTNSSGADYSASKWYQARRTLTGSGPVSWYLFGDPANEADMGSMMRVQLKDIQIRNGEIQIIPYNLAGDKNTNAIYSTSTANALYKAILPSANDGTCTFVAPGTSGTVHYDVINDKLTLKAGAATKTSGSKRAVFNEIQIDSSLPHVPTILYELGLAPIPGTKLTHEFKVLFGNTENIPGFGMTYEGSSGTTFTNLLFDHDAGWNANYVNTVRQRSRVIAQS